MNEMDGMEEVIGEFLVEANEELDQFDRDLVELEHDPSSSTLLARIFRAIHTIKGSGGTLGFQKLASLSHAGENVLSQLRDNTLVLNPEVTTALLEMADSLRQMLLSIAETGDDGENEYPHISARLSRVLDARSALNQETHLCGATSPDSVSVQKTNEFPVAGTPEMEEDDREPASAEIAQLCVPAEVSHNTIRVDVGLLDKLMNLVGELVLARNQVLQFTGTQKEAMFLGAAQRLNLITTELQEGVMKTRMQPIGTVWNKIPRMVRDLALGCGKMVQVEMSGANTELDKTIIEAIKGPLTHIMRNAVDHGIELPAVREAKGKPREGRLSLCAFHEGGQVNIEISDDGGGVHAELVKQKAIAKGIVTAEHAARMTEREILALIFAPGVSTAEGVTSISGRGVGMDVVKTSIEKIGGTIDLQSTPGQGMAIKIKIPLTLAIIPALIVASGGDRFAIPQVNLVELVRVEGEGAARGIEFIQGVPVYRLRGRLLPIAYLNRELKLRTSEENAATSVNIVVLHAGDREFGLVVDEINDTEEIVVKPLSKQLRNVRCFAGATIMGDGRVALILDVIGLAQLANVVGELRENGVTGETAIRSCGATAQPSTWLLFKGAENGRMAIPLGLVSRLEEFPAHEIERSAGKDVIQYRGQIMPLVRVSEALGMRGADICDPVRVIVYTHEGRYVGLVVDEIVDIAEENVEVVSEHCSNTILSSAVIQGHVTDLINLHSLNQSITSTAKGMPA